MRAKTEEIYSLTGKQITDRINSGKLSVREVVGELISRINDQEKKVKAWAYFDADLFMEQAVKLQERIDAGRKTGALRGVPAGVKDIFNTKDMPTCMGSPLWKDFTPGNDARVVFSLKQEDALIAGKTVTAEFAVHEPGETRNPHNVEYYPGTSSSGSAASVACGMVPVSIGTQTAGSVIRPASYCGVYGFKPSFGTIPRTGVLKTTDTLDQIGWFSRCIEDLKILFDVMRVKGRNYPYVHRTIDEYRNKDKDVWKVGVVKHPKWDDADDYAKEQFDRFVNSIASTKQVSVEEVKLHPDFNSAHENHDMIYSKALSYYFKEECQYIEVVSEVLVGMIEKGQDLKLEQYKKAIQFQGELAKKVDTYFDTFDVLLTLSTSGEAPRFETPQDKPDSCLIWNMTYLPVMNVPLFKGPNDLPFGLQIVGRRYEDPKLFDFARWLKRNDFAKDTEAITVE
ncbi:MAG: amidase [Candidatus Omnitrophica bacterium]|nr:amidase [Candidatus Omnitrophota bacterium]